MARSRYSRLGVIDENQYETFTLDQSNSIKAPDTFEGIRTRQYTVKLGDRLDHLAAKFLNEDEYWWIIALVNDLVGPWLTPGQKIKIPFSAQDVLERI